MTDLARLAALALDWLTARLTRAAAWCWRHADA
jgi:hypothetical protein